MPSAMMEVMPTVVAPRRKIGIVRFGEGNASMEQGEAGDLRKRSPKYGSEADTPDNRTNFKHKLERIYQQELTPEGGAPSAPPMSDLWAQAAHKESLYPPPMYRDTRLGPPPSYEESKHHPSDNLRLPFGANRWRAAASERSVELADDVRLETSSPAHQSANHAMETPSHPPQNRIYEDYADTDEEEESEEKEERCGRRCLGCPSCGDDSRDVVCMVLFVLSWLFWMLLVWTTITDGCPGQCNDPRRLIYGADSHSNEMCAHGALQTRQKLFFPYPENPAARRMCVTECPTSLSDDALRARELGLIEPYGAEGKAANSAPLNLQNLQSLGNLENCFLTKKRPCYYPSYSTVEVLGKCVPLPPTNLSAAQVLGFPGNGTAYLLASEFVAAPMGWIGEVASELAQTWRVVVGVSCSAVGVGFLWLLALRWAAMSVVVLLVLLVLLGLLFVTLMAFDVAGVTHIAESVLPALAAYLATIPISPAGAYAVAIVLAIATAVFFVVVLAMARRGLVAVRLIQEAARAVSDMPSLLLVPLTNIPALLLLAVWVSGAGLLLASAGDMDPVLGTYARGVQYAGTAGPSLFDSSSLAQRESASCPQRVLERNPLNASAVVDGVERKVSYAVTRFEAERLCVVYKQPARAVAGWQIRVATLLTRAYAGKTAVDGGQLGGGEADEVFAGAAYGGWARDYSSLANSTVEDWLMGGFRANLPFRIADYYIYYWGYYLLLTLWTYTFATTAAVMVAAGAVGHWYFRTEDMPLRRLPVVRSGVRLVVYQLGTLAFASLVVALAWMLRLAVQWAAKKLKALRALPFASILLCAMQCCTHCLEQFVRFVNRSTVIVAAVTGKGYCASARQAASLLLSNVLRVAAVSVASRLLLFLGQVLVSGGCTTLAWWILSADPFGTHGTRFPEATLALHADSASALASRPPVASLCIVAVCSWFLARAVMGVYWVVIDCVMMCFFYDSAKENPLPCTQAIQGRWLTKRILDEKDGNDESDTRWKRNV